MMTLFKQTPPRRPVRWPPVSACDSREVSIWLGASRVVGRCQKLVCGDAGRDVLFGSGELPDLGPGARPGAGQVFEFLLPVRFAHRFRDVPQVIPFLLQGLADPPAAPRPGVCELSVRNITTAGFTLAFHLPPGSPRLHCRFDWAAAGQVDPEPLRLSALGGR